MTEPEYVGAHEAPSTPSELPAPQPTQVRRPWQATVRTAIQAVVAICAMVPGVWSAATGRSVEQATGYAAAGLMVAAAVCRVMAMPAVNDWLARYLSPAAAGPTGGTVTKRGAAAGVGAVGFLGATTLTAGSYPQLWGGIWAAILLLFAVAEGIALRDPREDDTFSETTRRVLHTATPGGRAAFIALLVGGAAWYGMHIIWV